MSSTAYLVHRVPGRLRFKLPERRGDVAFFRELVPQLSALEGVLAVRASPDTGSVLILHGDGFQASLLGAVGTLLELSPEPYVPPSAFSRAASGLGQLDAWIARETRGGSSVNSIFFLVLVGMALVQISRGQVMAPATSLLWYALDLMRDRGSG
ncbi:HMA2 domain-containing protein [Thioalkalivibrio sulfidiphilus]|uniref:HMA2 domain-containing protein n=1 Tax=Thioalkalivibrio sulfidiphilus TaxID=1033854 RepID=UPI00036A5F60|nr:hypothetical protein [Thioalkalivibrio sulfidiphilus]